MAHELGRERSAPGHIDVEGELVAWRSGKRPFSATELVIGRWLKIGTHQWNFLVRFSPDGTFTESHLFDAAPEAVTAPSAWTGNWRLIGPVLRMVVISDATYELDVFASRTGSIHSGIEVWTQGASQPHAYFRLVHVD